MTDAYALHQAWLAEFRARHAVSLEHYRASLEALAVRQQARLISAETAAPDRPEVALTYATVGTMPVHA